MHDIIRVALAMILVSWLLNVLLFGKQYVLKKQRAPTTKPNLPILELPVNSDAGNEKSGTRLVDEVRGDLLLPRHWSSAVADNPRSEQRRRDDLVYCPKAVQVWFWNRVR